MKDKAAMKVLKVVEHNLKVAAKSRDLSTITRAFAEIEKKKGVVLDAVETAAKPEFRPYIKKVFELIDRPY